MMKQPTPNRTNSTPIAGPQTVSPSKTQSTSLHAHLILRNWLVFGAGPHVCLGQNYAIMHLAMCLGKAALHLDWDHKTTEISDNIRYDLVMIG
jgi:cytochrome P450